MKGTIRLIDKRGRSWHSVRFGWKGDLKAKLKEITLKHWNKIETGEWEISVLMDSDDTIITTTKGI